MPPTISTPSQLRAITSTAKHTIVLAGPGSGKTTVAKHRVQFLLEQDEISQVGLVSFTKASAIEIKHRLIADGITGAQVVSGTFHGLAIMQTKKAGLKIDAKRDVVQKPSQFAHINAAIADSRWPKSTKEALAVLERSGAYLHPTLDTDEQLLVETYRESLRIHGKTDFAGLIRKAVIGMQLGKIAPLSIDHLLVDETQDIDDLQLWWILLHAISGIPTTLVADDDQSIYRFRHALGLAGLRRYSQCVDLPIDDWLYLQENFRCRPEIVEVSQCLIKHGTDRIPKEITATRSVGGEVECKEFKSEEEELTRLALTAKISPNTWAVLARTRIELDRVELALEQRGIPYWRDAGDSIWDSGIGEAVLRLLSSLLPTDEAPKNILEALMVLDAFDASNDDRKSILSSKDVRTLFSFIATHLAKLAKEDRKQTAIRGLEELWLSWQEHLEGETNGNAESTKQVLSEVRDWFSTFVDEKETSLLNAIFRCLLKRRGYLRNRIEAPRFKKDAPADGVVLSTMHGAKGLEFDHVWAIGLDASDEDKMDPDVIEEERRLVYVAFTRAKNRLVTSYVTSNKPSMFLREAGLVLERAPRKRTRRAVYGKPA